ncbi:unnamed protein product [Victoria cruziana]
MPDSGSGFSGRGTNFSAFVPFNFLLPSARLWIFALRGIETYDWFGGPLDKKGFPLFLLVDSAENCAEQTD